MIVKALKFSLTLFLFCGLIYPMAMTVLGQLLFPHQANGSLIYDSNGKIIGSELLGQPFTRIGYFHPRPAVNHYDAANTGGSNLGSTSKKLVDRIAGDRQQYAELNPWEGNIPVDAVTASGSNLDPHISLANAMAQENRVANARGGSPQTIHELIVKHTEQPFLSQAPYVNVLRLNLALDHQYRKEVQQP